MSGCAVTSIFCTFSHLTCQQSKIIGKRKPVDSLVAPALPLSHGVPVDAHIYPGEPLWEAVSDSQLPPLGASAAMHPRHAFPGLLCDYGARAFCVQKGLCEPEKGKGGLSHQALVQRPSPLPAQACTL